MIILDAITKSLKIVLGGAVTTNQLQVTSHWIDITTALFTPGSTDIVTNNTTAVELVGAPAISTQRNIKAVSVYNADTIAATVIIQYVSAGGTRQLIKVTLQAGEQLYYEDGMGWNVLDANGGVIRGTNVSDIAYAASWDNVTTIAPSKNAVYDQMQLQMLKTGSNLAIGPDADGDMYYRASSALAPLAKGTANFKLFMNAGATAPEWAAGIYLGSFDINTATATGHQHISGIPFKPTAVILFAAVDSTLQISWGFDDGTNHLSVAQYIANQWTHSATKSIMLYQTNAITYMGYVSAMEAGGFQYEWELTGAKTGNVYVRYMALR